MGDTKIRGQVPLFNRVEIKLRHPKALRRYCMVAHSPASRVMDYVGESVWNSCFKFCFVRHPLDRTMSQYFWKAPTKSWHDAETNFTRRFDFFLESKEFRQLILKGTGIYMNNGKVAVDYIGKFENLPGSLEHAMRQAGVDLKPVELHQLKSGFRPRRNFADMLLRRQKKIIENAVEFEFDHFGYKM